MGQHGGASPNGDGRVFVGSPAVNPGVDVQFVCPGTVCVCVGVVPCGVAAAVGVCPWVVVVRCGGDTFGGLHCLSGWNPSGRATVRRLPVLGKVRVRGPRGHVSVSVPQPAG